MYLRVLLLLTRAYRVGDVRAAPSLAVRLACKDLPNATTQVLSLSIDFYVRVFVRVHTSAETVRDSACKQMYVYQSSGCDSFYMQPVGRKVRAAPGCPLRPPAWEPMSAACKACSCVERLQPDGRMLRMPGCLIGHA